MKNSATPTIIVFAMLIFLRIISYDSKNLTIIVSILNIIALLTVVVSIVEKIKLNFINIIKDYSVPKEVLNRNIRSFSTKLVMLSYIPFSFLAGVYLVFFSSTLGNDILSIISLGLSLIDSNIAESIIKKIKI